MLKDLILKNRSYRRFHQEVPVPMELLREMVEAARLSGSARNMQALRYMLFNDPFDCARIFPALAWAGYLKDWPGPAEGERPSAYIVQLGDLALNIYIPYHPLQEPLLYIGWLGHSFKRII